MHFEGTLPFKMHEIFSQKPEKNSRFHHKIKVGSGYPKHRYFLFGLSVCFKGGGR